MYRRSFKSAEHVFQYRCAYEKGDDNLAEKIINSSHAGVAKRLAQDIHSEESFSKHEHNSHSNYQMLLQNQEISGLYISTYLVEYSRIS